MKKLFSILGFILLAVLAVSCIEPWEEPAGKFSISFGGTNGSARSLYEDREQLVFTIKLSNGPGADQSVKDIKYGQTVNFSVVPGRWDIYVAAWLEGVVKAEHSRTVVIKPGRNDPIKITLDEKGNVIVECNHEWGDWEITEAATCVAPGIGSRVCEICNAEETEIPIDPNAHNFGASATVTKEATCDDEDGEGEEEGTCELCGKKTTKTLAKLDHVWGEWVVNPAPTYTTEGVETRTCTLDPDHTDTRPVSRIPFTTVADLQTWYASAQVNTTTNPYTINLQTDDITGIRDALGGATGTKYVYLDLTGSTIETIPVQTFGTSATVYTAALVGVTIPDGVITIEEYAFMNCANLASVTIPNSVTSIGDGAFGSGYGASMSLTSVTIPDSVTSIGDAAFRGCSSLTSITINSDTTIGYGAFDFCDSLASVTIGSGITSLDSNLPLDSTSLTTINVDAGNSEYSSENGVLYNKNKTALILYPRGKTANSFTIPGGVTSIGEGAFYRCTSLTSITIPASVTSIGSRAFYWCTSLTSVTFQGTITWANFSEEACTFGDGEGNIGYLRDVFYATDSANGTPGTYTTPTGGFAAVWTKE